MISWTDLRKFPLDQKVMVLYQHATFVTAIRYYNHKVNLYLLGNEYVEVFVNHKKAMIDKIDLLLHQTVACAIVMRITSDSSSFSKREADREVC